MNGKNKPLKIKDTETHTLVQYHGLLIEEMEYTTSCDSCQQQAMRMLTSIENELRKRQCIHLLE